MPIALDLTGKRFGRLTVVARAPKRLGCICWSCACDCGGSKVVLVQRLRNGRVRSCGCLRAESARRCGALFSGETHIKHGEAIGGKASPEARTWYAMWQRCTDPKQRSWKYYGARGIAVCERWKSLEAFVSDMGRRPTPQRSIERINNDGNYEPRNCRWATPAEQSRNKRKRGTA